MDKRAASPLFPPERWRELRELLDRLEELDDRQRDDTLARLATQDAELANAARAMLGDPQATQPQEAAVNRLLGKSQDISAPGSVIGPFELVRHLGVGGMGAVYLALRRKLDFQQSVALKLLEGDAARMARIASRERRILASLQHPNIPAFVDAGVHKGRAWLAMEYVDGAPLLAWCNERALDVRARVTLFDQVCNAVAYAHAQLVVHRDLKPANVLVNGDGVVKLLDFGIALMLDNSDEQAPATRVFTPEYAAPEQLRGERISTATDIYALGLVLYELVSGKRLSTIDHGKQEWTTRELAQHAMTDTAPSTARTNRSVPNLLRGDLGRIIAHALAPEPAQRYGTVAQMRADLQRWLELRPLTISRPGFAYVARRFVRRNRAAASIATAAVIALLATVVFAFHQAAVAQRMATRAGQAKNFLASLLTDADPFSSTRSTKSKIDLLRDAGQRLDKEMPEATDDRIELRKIIVNALMRLGEPGAARDLQQVSVDELRRMHGANSPNVGAALQTLAMASENAGDIATARIQIAEGYALLEHAGDTWRRARISALTAMAKLANRNDDYAQAQHWHEAAMRERIRMAGAQSADVAMDLMNLASDALYQERFADAESLALRAREMLIKTSGANHARMVYIANILGIAQTYNGRYQEAVRTLTDALALAKKTLPPGAEIRNTITTSLAFAHLHVDDLHSARALLAPMREALQATGKSPSPSLELNLGRIQLRAGQREAAATLARAHADWVAARTKIATAPKVAALAKAAYGAALAQNGAVADGIAQIREAHAELRSGPFSDSVFLGYIDLYYADALKRAGDAAAARTQRREAYDLFLRKLGPAHPMTVETARQLASVTP